MKTALCGCATDGGDRKAHGVDPELKAGNLKRLRRIEGQIRGLQAMIEADRYCPDIMAQVASAHEALRSVGRELMRNHLRHCVTAAVKAGGTRAQEGYDELLDLIYTHAR